MHLKTMQLLDPTHMQDCGLQLSVKCSFPRYRLDSHARLFAAAIINAPVYICAFNASEHMRLYSGAFIVVRRRYA